MSGVIIIIIIIKSAVIRDTDWMTERNSRGRWPFAKPRPLVSYTSHTWDQTALVSVNVWWWLVEGVKNRAVLRHSQTNHVNVSSINDCVFILVWALSHVALVLEAIKWNTGAYEPWQSWIFIQRAELIVSAADSSQLMNHYWRLDTLSFNNLSNGTKFSLPFSHENWKTSSITTLKSKHT